MIVLWIALFTLFVPFAWPHRWLVREGKRYLLRWPLLGGDGLKRAPLWLGNNLVRTQRWWKWEWVPNDRDNLFLHLIIRSDGAAVHSHPWWAKARILIGRYRDVRQFLMFDADTGKSRWTEPRSKEFGPGDVNFIDARAYHTLQLLSLFCLTLCRTGRKHGRGWGFKVGDQVVNASGRGAAAYDEAHEKGAA